MSQFYKYFRESMESLREGVRMKDSLLLLFVSIVTAALAWVFWKSFGSEGFGAITLLAIVVLIADNARLRRQLAAKSPTS